MRNFMNRLRYALSLRLALLPDFLFVAAVGGLVVLLFDDKVEGVGVLLITWLVVAVWWTLVDYRR